MPTKPDLIREVGAALGRLGAGYASSDVRDKLYGVWLFAMFMDAAPRASTLLYGIDSPGDAVFRGKPANLDEPARYTFGLVEGLRRRWEITST